MPLGARGGFVLLRTHWGAWWCVAPAHLSPVGVPKNKMDFSSLNRKWGRKMRKEAKFILFLGFASAFKNSSFIHFATVCIHSLFYRLRELDASSMRCPFFDIIPLLVD